MSIFSKKPSQEAVFSLNKTRLSRLRDNAGLFTSNLSVNEFSLCASLGISPLGQVIGSTVYQISPQMPPFVSGELTYLTKALYSVRQLVFSRLQQEAELVGAHGVVGVCLERTVLQPGSVGNGSFRQQHSV